MVTRPVKQDVLYLHTHALQAGVLGGFGRQAGWADAFIITSIASPPMLMGIEATTPAANMLPTMRFIFAPELPEKRTRRRTVRP